MKSIILASKSEVRKKILDENNIKCAVEPSNLDEEEVILRKGTVVLVPGGVLQYVQNTGSSDLVFLCICDPAWSEQQELVLNDLL